MLRGVAPSLLLEQVKNTAAWALDPASLPSSEDWARALLDAPALQARLEVESEPSSELRVAHLRLLLAAHHATVGTFVPTDVDARIRHHAWQEMNDLATLAAAVDVVDRASTWDPHLVSARVVDASRGPLSGHDGEWLSVRAGAVGRALQLAESNVDVGDLVERVQIAIDAEVAREAEIMRAAIEDADAPFALRVTTTIAHNFGDLSRVVEEWPARGDRARSLRARWARLGHDDPSRHGGVFVVAGRINKAVMASENHRFLPLRKPRGLRRARALLLPIGPFFDAWGATVATNAALDAADRAEVLGVVLEAHESAPQQQGYLRALVGMHGAHPGGLEAIAASLPARARRRVAAGSIREAIGVDRARFEARMSNRWRAALVGRE